MPGGSTLTTSAPKSESIVGAAGAAMKLAISTTFRPENTESVVCVVIVIDSLYERAQAGDRLADDQRLHFPGALVRVQSLRIRDEAADVVVQKNAIPSQQLPRPVHGLTQPHSPVSLPQRRLPAAIHP